MNIPYSDKTGVEAAASIQYPLFQTFRKAYEKQPRIMEEFDKQGVQAPPEIVVDYIANRTALMILGSIMHMMLTESDDFEIEQDEEMWARLYNAGVEAEGIAEQVAMLVQTQRDIDDLPGTP